MAKPEQSFRIGGCSASVFLNSDDEQREYRTVQLQRRYRDDAGEWQNSTSFTLSQLPAAIKVMELALDYLASHEASTTA